MKRVIVFGAFDPLHEGHRDFFRQAKTLGDHLLVVIARDSSIRGRKNREPFQTEDQRLAAVTTVPDVDDAMLGREGGSPYALLGELEFDIVALGYDQKPADDVVRQALDRYGKDAVDIVRLKPHKPGQFKSSLLR